MIEIRQIGPDDLAAYKAIRASALENNPEAFGMTLGMFKKRDDNTHIQGLQKTYTDPHSATFLAFDSDNPVGMAGIVRQENPKMRHKAFLWGMYISASHRGQGIGAKLVENILDVAKKSDTIIQVHLTVVSENAGAIQLYKKFGFETWGKEPRAFKTPDGYADELHMVLKEL